MALLFDAASRRIVLDVTAISATELWSRWSDWAASGDNSKYLPAFQQVGGNDLGSSLSIPPYFFLLNGWRVRPLEGNHALTITGNLFVDGGGVPVVPTLGAFNVSVQYTVPVQAQGISTGGSGLTAPQAAMLEAIHKLVRADDKMLDGFYRKYEEGTNNLLLEKVVTGGSLAQEITLVKP